MPNVPYETVRYGRNEFIQHEDTADSALRAGMLLERVGDGVGPHSTAAGAVSETLVAYEDRGMGMELHPDPEHDKANYEAGDNAKYYAASGGGLTMWISGGETVTEDDELISNGDGTIRPRVGDGTEEDAATVAIAAEDVDASDGTDALGDTDIVS